MRGVVPMGLHRQHVLFNDPLCGPSSGLMRWKKKELDELAQKENIPNRTKLSIDQLCEALNIPVNYGPGSLGGIMPSLKPGAQIVNVKRTPRVPVVRLPQAPPRPFIRPFIITPTHLEPRPGNNMFKPHKNSAGNAFLPYDATSFNPTRDNICARQNTDNNWRGVIDNLVHFTMANSFQNILNSKKLSIQSDRMGPLAVNCTPCVDILNRDNPALSTCFRANAVYFRILAYRETKIDLTDWMHWGDMCIVVKPAILQNKYYHINLSRDYGFFKRKRDGSANNSVKKKGTLTDNNLRKLTKPVYMENRLRMELVYPESIDFSSDNIQEVIFRNEYDANNFAPTLLAMDIGVRYIFGFADT
jgi:hypothetical protein